MSDPLQQYPFERVWVDHLVSGVTRVWWRHHPNFVPVGDCTYQLQISQTGLASALDWVNIGSPATNVFTLTDAETRLQGKKSRIHYRVLVVNNEKQGVSLPAGTWGLLDDQAWLKAREILRLHEINHRQTARHGFLLKRMRTGTVDQNAVNPLSGAVIDSRRTQTMGTEFEIGYHPPVPCTCMELTPQEIDEAQSEAGPIRNAVVQGLTSAFPQLDYEDIWVDARSDERWSVEKVKNEVELRGVPLIVQATLQLMPRSDVVYKIPVDAYSPVPQLMTKRGPSLVANPVLIDHNYGGPDALTYADAQGCGIIGARILLFTKSAYDSGLTGEVSALAVGYTGQAGRWMTQFRIDPGQYVLVFEKPGECGPDAHELIVAAP